MIVKQNVNAERCWNIPQGTEVQLEMHVKIPHIDYPKAGRPKFTERCK